MLSPVSGELGDSGDPHVDVGNFIPGGKVGHAGLGKAEDRLKCLDGGGGVGPVEAVRGYTGDGGVDGGDGFQLLLEPAHLLPGGADGQIFPRPGGGNPGDLLRRVDVDAGAVEMAEDLDRAVSALSQGA